LFTTLIQAKVANLLLFNKKASQVTEFVTAYKLYIKMRMRDVEVKEQVQWILTYVQKESVDI